MPPEHVAWSARGRRRAHGHPTSLPFLDLVIGGHSHIDLDAPQWVGKVPVLTARAFAYYAGVAEVEVGEAGAQLVAWRKVPLRDDAPPVRAG